ncbi:MAG: hypothetical protein HY881_21040 [Deltaproteobacteria bacterium]|nr:hypothetical protein [Deltaproteobacteria bacterium]
MQDIEGPFQKHWYIEIERDKKIVPTILELAMSPKSSGTSLSNRYPVGI